MDYKNLLPSGASYEIKTERTKTNSVKFDGNKFERFTAKDKTALTARVLHDGKLSIASGTKPGSSEELVKQAVEMAPYGSGHDVSFVGNASIKPMNLESSDTISAKEMADIAGGVVEDLRSLDSRISASVTLSSNILENSLHTSNGFDANYRKTNWQLSASIDLTVDGDRLGLYDWSVNTGPKFDTAKLKNTIAKKLNWAKNTVPFKAGAHPVIFSPDEVNYITLPILQSVMGRAVYQKVSPFGDKLGQQLFDPRFTLADDGSIDGEWTSRPFDGEGTPTKRNMLVENGKLGAFLTDRKYAALLGTESTGNAQGPNHLRITPGTKSLEEMIKSIDYGLLIDGSMGAWSGNPYAGIVTGTISMGLLIEKGEIKGRIKDCMFTVNAFEHLKNNLVDISAEVETNGFMSVNLFPYIQLSDVVISTN